MVIVIFFDLNTISPITLLELSLYAKDKRLVVYCPRKYFRWTNMEFVCRKYGVKQVYILEELAKEAIERVRCSKERSKVIERVECSKECSKEYGKGVMERVGCGEGRGDSGNGRVSWSNYLQIPVSK